VSLTEGIARWLGANVTGLSYSLTAGGNIFVDELPSDPDRCVAVFSQGGEEADSALPYDAPNVQIIVRGDSSPQWALDTWAAIYSKLHALRHVTLPGGTELVYALVQQSAPVRLGTDQNGRHEYSMNVRAETLNPTAERPA
jgi:hypothetical protein